ncbi:hypothetical protein IAR55_002662 [Kwoniella newhampshirensis]|uniref:Golgi-body localization protein domain-containing protein n=1 Tax=Kwoniella newhampshirensis TaxID=1651941 RepID=A0AAW0YZM4_9TREE
MSFITNCLVTILTVLFISRYFITPLLFRSLTQFRVSAFSLFSARGLEWRAATEPHDVIPTLRIERAKWAWGGIRGDVVGLLVLRIEGLSLRFKKGSFRKGEKNTDETTRRSSGRISTFKSRLIASVLQLLMHHYPSMARLVSIQLVNCRIIFDDMEGLEITLQEVGFGLRVNFQGEAEGAVLSPNSSSPTILREHPLCYSPVMSRDASDLSPALSSNLSPPVSPGFSPPSSPSAHVSFTFPPAPSINSSPTKRAKSFSRLSHARRRASVLQTRMSTTASQIWHRATGRMHGSVSFNTYINDVRLIQPHGNPASTRSSASEPSDDAQLRSKSSAKSLRCSSSSPDRPSFAPATSLRSILGRGPRYSLPIHEGGCEVLLAIDGSSTFTVGLGFGPKKGLLGEDTLSTDLKLGSLRITLDAVDKLLELSRGLKRDKTETIPRVDPLKRKDQWAPQAMPRIILRAFESVAIKFAHITFIHHLPTAASHHSRTHSRTSSSTSLSEISASMEESYTLSLELSDVGCTLSAADSSNNERARNAFGTNASPESKVRGIAFEFRWDDIQVQCVAPGETVNQKSQLLAIQQAEFTGFSTWRPFGWTREELLFANDPNLALIVGRGDVASIDCAGDLQLAHELESAWHIRHPTKPKPPVSVLTTIEETSAWLPPRVRVVLDVGHMMAIVADRLSENTTTLTFASDGLHIGCFTGFSDLIGRRRSPIITRTAFKEEEKLEQRRETEPDADYALPSSMLPSAVRRRPVAERASLRDDLSISMRGEAQLSMEPIRVNMTLSGDQLYDLAEIGRIHGTATGDILGRHVVKAGGEEAPILDWNSLSSSVDIGIQEGVYIDLWKEEVVEAIISLGQSRQHAAPAVKGPTEIRSIIDRLPSGVSARFSLGAINVFVGIKDPNPQCALGLTRGVWFQTTAMFEYALYKYRTQALPWRHTLTAPRRAKLQLPEDITTQALAFAAQYRPDGGRAALISLNCENTVVQPVFNGERFVKRGGMRQKLVVKEMPKSKSGDDFVGWGFQRLRIKKSLDTGEFRNNVPPLEISDTDQAQRPWLRIRNSRIHAVIQQRRTDAHTEHKITGRLDGVALITDLSHAYCNLLAAFVAKRIMTAWKRPGNITDARPRPNLSIEIAIPSMTAHFAFPLKEQLYLYASGLTILKQPAAGVAVAVDQILLYVPSPRMIGSWEELGRIKRIAVKMSDPGVPLVISPYIEAIRIRIPFSYQMNSLILNVNATVKAFKLLSQNFFTQRGFSTVHSPRAEQAKHIPTLSFAIGYMSLEAKDDPIETGLNLIWRVGLVEQARRNVLWDTFAKKTVEMANVEKTTEPDTTSPSASGRKVPQLTKNASVSIQQAHQALHLYNAQIWVRRMRAAKLEQRRRESVTLKPFLGVEVPIKLPIDVTPSSQTAPLFRAVFRNANLSLSDPGMTRSEIIDYMGKVSAPFEKDVEFTLMVPLKIEWSMSEARCSLRDYPLPLIRVQPDETGNRPSFNMKSTLIIAEELAGDDSTMYLPVPVIPAGCGHADSTAFLVQIAKTIMPVKMYAEPKFSIASRRTTEFTWGNSYQPGIQDLMRVIETLSHPPRDPSPKVGFWDKFRLILHWHPIVDFAGACHLHLKGSFDPYSVSGLGAGFALAWRGKTRLLINQPNDDGEVIQIRSDELLIAIPDHTHHRKNDHNQHEYDSDDDHEESDTALIERRYTKPCARFVNGVKVGFGFKFERTCRPWTCKEGCGSTMNLMHRQCHITHFKQHQQVILRSPDAVKRDEKRLGRSVDSYEGFRSDYIHFSVTLVTPTQEVPASKHEMVNSLHFAPKSTYHFLSWWKLFDHKMSLPIRQGKLFPDSPPPSKKFGRSIATMKDLWEIGKSESLGLKGRMGHFKAVAIQRVQEKKQYHAMLHKESVVYHKPFYAADIVANDLKIKGIRAHFAERIKSEDEDAAIDPLPKASELTSDLALWYNYFDYIDTDKKPFDRDPRMELVDLGDCPTVSISRRVKARANTPYDDEDSNDQKNGHWRKGVESSKFGHDPSHESGLGVLPTPPEEQIKHAQRRIDELLAMDPDDCNVGVPLPRRLDMLDADISYQKTLIREVKDETLETSDGSTENPVEFEDTILIHFPRLYFTNKSRNIAFTYFLSMGDRKKQEYMTAHAMLKSIQDSVIKRSRRRQPEAAEDITEQSIAVKILDDLMEFMTNQLKTIHSTFEMDEYTRCKFGLPEACAVKPKRQVKVFKPQIALRSEMAENAVVLLAVEEMSYRAFEVIDQTASDSMMADVLTRGAQGFYPTAEALDREKSVGSHRALDFVPLEIFLDTKSEATDYDRILSRMDISIPFDKFNHLRMPQGLEWPQDAVDEWGQPIKHLKVHQDLYTILVPRMSLSATSKHYDALFTVVTDLLMYQDPEHKHRSDAVDDFGRQFDAADRDPARLIVDVHTLQHTMRTLIDLQQGYEAHFDKLDEHGKDELFKMRADLQDGYESLYTINALIRATLAKDDARAAMKTASRMDVRIGSIEWRMLRDDMDNLIKLGIKGVLFSIMSNKNGSMDSAMLVKSLQALNATQGSLFDKILTHEEPGTGSRKNIKPFLALYWSSLPAIGGIPIYPIVDIDFANIKVSLEERIGHELIDYVFSDRIQRRHDARLAVGNGASGNGNGNSNSNGNSNRNGLGSGSNTPTSSVFRGIGSSSTDEVNKPSSSSIRPNSSAMELYPLSRSKSQQSLMSHLDTDPRKLRNNEDTVEMRSRAAKNKMFGQVRLHGMGFILNYKSDDMRKHPTFTMPDCVDFKFKMPEMVYQNKVWPLEEIFNHVKRDIKRQAWNQRRDLFSQVIKNTSVFRSKKKLALAAKAMTEKARSGSNPMSSSTSHGPISPSKLRNTVSDSSSTSLPDREQEEIIETLTRALSRDPSTSPQAALSMALSRSRSKSATAEYTSPSSNPTQLLAAGGGSSDGRPTSLKGSSGSSLHGKSSIKLQAQAQAQALARVISNGHVSGLAQRYPHSQNDDVDNSDDDDKLHLSVGAGGGRIKGFLGKLRGKHSQHRDGSSDELSRVISRSEMRSRQSSLPLSASNASA